MEIDIRIIQWFGILQILLKYLYQDKSLSSGQAPGNPNPKPLAITSSYFMICEFACVNTCYFTSLTVDIVTGPSKPDLIRGTFPHGNLILSIPGI